MQTLEITFPSTMLRFNKGYFLRNQKVHFVWQEHNSLTFLNDYRIELFSLDVGSFVLFNAILSLGRS
jgi:hypothetical protein